MRIIRELPTMGKQGYRDNMFIMSDAENMSKIIIFIIIFFNICHFNFLLLLEFLKGDQRWT